MPAFFIQSKDYDVTRLRGHRGGPSWGIDPARVAMLAHDLQPQYLDGLSARSRRVLVTQVERTLAWADDHQVPLLASGPRPSSHLSQRGLLGTCWGMGLSQAQAKEVAVPRLSAADVTRITKRSYSAFYATDLETELRRGNRDQLIIIGVYASHGILATSLEAIARDIQTFVPYDATADYTAYRHTAALDLISTMSGRVLAVDDLPQKRPRQ
ncbi:isochorismatase family protein [Streptomyces sp. NPDC048191]|uniref:isochorismatase family protein n=1 Tax=Streptomyces sp. NPDC048191 TaxID=3155484 RepID=UPI0033D3FDF8